MADLQSIDQAASVPSTNGVANPHHHANHAPDTKTDHALNLNGDGPEKPVKNDSHPSEPLPNGPQDHGKQPKPFPKPRQHAPLIVRPADTDEEKLEAALPLAEQAALANPGATDAAPEQQPSPEKLPSGDASVGEKREREEPEAPPVEQQPLPSVENSNGHAQPAAPRPEPVLEPEAKKVKVDGEQQQQDEPSEQRKKKNGRPKKEDARAAAPERKNSISSRTRSKAAIM